VFVGHLGAALIGKRLEPSLSLGWCVGAAMALDLLWPLLLLAGLERVRVEPGAMAFTPLVFVSYPWSHSLLAAAFWAALVAAAARRWCASTRGAWLVAGLVVSHWVLDAATHAPDLPLWPGPSPRVGLGLWRSVPATLLVEGALWAGAVAAYVRTRRPPDRAGRAAFWSLVIVCTFLWAAGPWSPPPPSAQALAWFALISWALIPWALLADRGRSSLAASRSAAPGAARS
jgi:membrane-bound metal-dependent hydrolase YbcI (DUF457 family)